MAWCSAFWVFKTAKTMSWHGFRNSEPWKPMIGHGFAWFLYLLRIVKYFTKSYNRACSTFLILKKDRFQMRNLSFVIGYFPWLREESFHAVWFIAICIPFAFLHAPKSPGIIRTLEYKFIIFLLFLIFLVLLFRCFVLEL